MSDLFHAYTHYEIFTEKLATTKLKIKYQRKRNGKIKQNIRFGNQFSSIKGMCAVVLFSKFLKCLDDVGMEWLISFVEAMKWPWEDYNWNSNRLPLVVRIQSSTNLIFIAFFFPQAHRDTFCPFANTIVLSSAVKNRWNEEKKTFH